MYTSFGVQAIVVLISVAVSQSAAAEISTLLERDHTPNANITHLPPQFFPDYNSERVKISYGPYTVPAMADNNGMKNIQESSTPLPCTDCLITWMQAGLEYADGSIADADNGMWLHHTVFVNTHRQSALCPTKKHGEEFFASGNERTPVDICVSGTEKAGYYIGPDDDFAMVLELMNMVDEPRDAILSMTYEYVPGVPKGFDRVRSYWLDIGGCGSSEVPAEPDAAFQYSSPSWTSNSTGRITFIGSHLHDGGTHTEVTKNGEIVCRSVAGYGSEEETATEVHISSMSYCTNLGNTKPGDEWSITAYYNTSKHLPMTNADGSLEPVMGISLVYVAETTETPQGHRTLKIVLACSAVAVALALAVLLVVMKGRALRDFFRRNRKAVSMEDGQTRMDPLLAEEYRDEDWEVRD